MFDANKTSEEIIEFIRNYYKENNLKGAVIGISGGKDSFILAKCLQELQKHSKYKFNLKFGI